MNPHMKNSSVMIAKGPRYEARWLELEVDTAEAVRGGAMWRVIGVSTVNNVLSDLCHAAACEEISATGLFSFEGMELPRESLSEGTPR